MSPASPGSPSSAVPPTDSAYRLAPGVVVRLLGAALAVLALVVVLVTVLVAVADLSAAVLVVVVAIGLVLVLGLAAALTRRLVAVRLGREGYRVHLPRLVRGVGVPAAPWREVTEAVTTTTPSGLPVVVLKLVDARSTTIPVTLLATDREEFVRDLQQHLQHGQGRRPL